MSEFKFACPVCGQHIKCEPDKTGAHMECPNCFRQIVVPQPPASADTKFVLTTSEVRAERPVGHIGPPPLAPLKKPSAARDFLLWTAALVILAGALGAVFTFRDKLFKPAPPRAAAKTNLPPVAPTPTPTRTENTNWQLSLDGVTLPDTTATGQLGGFSFTCDRSTVQGGTLNLRQGPAWPPEVGVTVYLRAARGENLAGQSFNFTPDSAASPPRLVLRWTDPQHGPVRQEVTAKYALRVEFGQVSSNHISGKIFLRIADYTQSHAAGTFDAEIRPPAPPRPRRR